MHTLSTPELQRMRKLNNELEIINVLDHQKFEAGHIPDTDNVPLEDAGFEQEVVQMTGGKGKPVVVYCASEDCTASPQAAERLEKAGFTDVYDYAGGTKAWHEAGLPIEGNHK